jgi:hypothetical protein
MPSDEETIAAELVDPDKWQEKSLGKGVDGVTE